MASDWDFTITYIENPDNVYGGYPERYCSGRFRRSG